MAVDTHGLCNITYLVGETNLESVKRVIGVFDHFGHPQLCSNQWPWQTLVEFGHSIPRFLVKFTYDGLRRIIEVRNRCAFAQELRVHADTKITPDLFPRTGFQRRYDSFLHRAWNDGTSDDYREVFLFGGERLADLLTDTQNGPQIDIPVD